MTVSTTTLKVSYSGNGSTAAFAYTFKIFAQSELKVIIRSSAGVESTKTLTTHFTVSGVGSASGGNVTFTSGNIPASGETVVILRDTPLTQATDYVENDPFPAASHMDALDKLTHINQELQEELDRSIKLSKTNSMTNSEFTTAAADRANKILSFSSDGQSFTVVDQTDSSDFSTDNFAVASDGTVTIKDAGVAAAELGSDIITGQTALTSGLASTDEFIVSDAGTTKRMDVSVLSTYQAALSETLTNKTLTSPVINTGVSGTGIKDEDDMSSDSATHLATQQSIKAYVDAEKADMSFVLEDDDGTEITITKDKEVKIIGSGVTSNWTDTDNGTDGDPYDLTITVDAAQTGITSLLATDIKIGEDNETKIDFEDADTINFYAGNEKQLILTDGALTPGANNILDLGTDSLEFKDGYFDGTLEADSITVAGTNLTAIYSPIAGSSSITTLGTISTGTWQGTAIASAYIAADAITAAKIADDAISEEHLDNTAVTGFSALSTVADDDVILISDTSDSSNLKKITRSNFVSGLATTDPVAMAIALG